jgi:predicted dehydrogenase
MRNWTVGIIGCGWIAPFHAKALHRLRDRATVVWVADPDVERATRLVEYMRSLGSQEGRSAARPGIHILSDYHTGLGDVDAVFILVPHHLHHPITVDALRAGCHVLLEKPFALTLAQAHDMIAHAERQGKLLMVAYPHRYRRSTIAFKEWIDSGEFGDLFFLDALMDEDLRGYALGWIAKKETLGGGVFFSSSPHMLDVMVWIAGDVQTVAMVGTHGGLDMEGEDTAAAVLAFTNGVIGTTRHTWASPKPGVWYTMRAVCQRALLTLTVNPLGDLVREGVSCEWRSKIEVTGSRNEILLETGEGLDLIGEVTHFFDCLDTGQPCKTDGRVALKLMELVLGAYEKAEREGGIVNRRRQLLRRSESRRPHE